MIPLWAGKSFRPAALVLALVTLAFSIQGPECEDPGWSPDGFGVKDHTVFHHAGFTYIAAIYLPGEQQFAYARSLDLCAWEVLDPILTERTDGDWDENRIWAPSVIEEGGTYYMYYTGVNDFFAQSIMLAATNDPADPSSWTELGLAFQPSHPGAVWSPTSWSDNRDPMVVKAGETFYLLYTGRDLGGGIVGLATAPAPTGPWTDLGATVGPIPGRILESPTYFFVDGTGYLLYHNTWSAQTFGAGLRSGPSPAGPWSPESFFFPGWAHEIWLDHEDAWQASYLSSYEITINPLGWDLASSPATPYIDIPIWKALVPFVQQTP